MAEAGAPLTLRSRVPADARGMRLLDFLAERFRYHDRARWQRELAERRLSLDGRPATGDEPLRAGMRLVYEKQHVEPPVDDRIGVLHEDEDLLAVDKPAHLPMHADGPFIRNTLIGLLRTRRGEPDLQLVHRLDRETSGLCLVAKSQRAQLSLQQQFRDGTVQKTYAAVVHGRVAGPLHIDLPIGHKNGAEVRLRRSAAPDALQPRPARTDCTVLEHGSSRTLLACQPRTGRTHQIRVHLEAVGHPIVGDRLYGRSDADYLAFVRHVKAAGSVHDVPHGEPDRQLLHALEIVFDHPGAGRRTTLRAPLPPVFGEFLHSTTSR